LEIGILNGKPFDRWKRKDPALTQRGQSRLFIVPAIFGLPVPFWAGIFCFFEGVKRNGRQGIIQVAQTDRTTELPVGKNSIRRGHPGRDYKVL
jgi:hypothetical protein